MTVLEALKATDQREYLSLVFSDSDARAVLLGWTLYGPPPRPVQWALECPPAWSVRRLLNHCWRKMEIDSRKLSMLSGIPMRTVEEKFERLKEARLIFPDGTASPEALLIIRADMERAVRAAQLVPQAPINAQVVPDNPSNLPAVR